MMTNQVAVSQLFFERHRDERRDDTTVLGVGFTTNFFGNRRSVKHKLLKILWSETWQELGWL